MSQLNKVVQYVIKIFNYKTYIQGKGYFTANLIEVYERYYNLYHNNSEVEKMDMWTDILQKWYNSFQNRLIKNLKRKLNHKPLFKCPDMYKEDYDDFITRFKYTIRARIGDTPPNALHNETNYDTLRYIHDDYMNFINDLNHNIRSKYRKITYKETHYNPKTYAWYESKEILPGHYSDITHLNPQNLQNYRYHPVLLDLGL